MRCLWLCNCSLPHHGCQRLFNCWKMCASYIFYFSTDFSEVFTSSIYTLSIFCRTCYFLSGHRILGYMDAVKVCFMAPHWEIGLPGTLSSDDNILDCIASNLFITSLMLCNLGRKFRVGIHRFRNSWKISVDKWFIWKCIIYIGLTNLFVLLKSIVCISA